MADIPFLVKDLALILMVAGIVTLIFKSWFRHTCPTPCR